MTKDDASKAYQLVSLYLSLYKEKYNKTVIVNRHKEKWAMADVIDSVGFEKAKELLTYYFNISKSGHPLQWFLYNFERLDILLLAKKDDEEKRSRMRELTKRMVEDNE
jgi:hypothetical protein